MCIIISASFEREVTIMAYQGYTDAKKACNARYAAKQDIFHVRLAVGQRDRIKSTIETTGESFNQFILAAIEERLRKEGK